ncbi:hypothetical protein [Aquibium oceanicum]|uniref:Uncharacterized protein n=1 Tax=Aquibium oceanicum TaxID=1670800 RepID=A0A1L3SPY9_9HYPH|nr:hypothetical protein [Aquibium oceanicum]APH71483.1 hypothetical protein BSQ44_08945 [Aquibium oceanicum]
MHTGLPDDRTLRRLAALLVAMAVLSERAAARSFPVRWIVLSLLRVGAAVTETFVVEVTQLEWPCPDGAWDFRGDVLDAAWLALRLRALAAVIEALAGLPSGVDAWISWVVRETCNALPPARRSFAMPGGWSPAPNDTS